VWVALIWCFWWWDVRVFEFVVVLLFGGYLVMSGSWWMDCVGGWGVCRLGVEFTHDLDYRRFQVCQAVGIFDVISYDVWEVIVVCQS